MRGDDGSCAEGRHGGALRHECLFIDLAVHIEWQRFDEADIARDHRQGQKLRQRDAAGIGIETCARLLLNEEQNIDHPTVFALRDTDGFMYLRKAVSGALDLSV